VSQLIHLVEQVFVVSQIIVNFLHSDIFTQFDIRPQAIDISSHKINLPLLLLDY
jgi:hypothetical protein